QTLASHHAASTVPTALAVGERTHASGRDVITALVVADDIAARLLAASGGVDFVQGWDGAAIYSVFGATAAAGWLLGLDADGLRHALGIALNQAAGTVASVWDGATDFKLAQGVAARMGVLAA